MKNASTLKRIWVCGPPRMNEEFDKNLEILCPKYGIGKDQYEIM